MPSTDLEQRSPARDLVAQIRQDDVLQEQIKAVLPANVTFAGFTSALMTALVDDAVRQPDASQQLVNADRLSLFQAVVKCAADGLLPNGKQAALVVFNGKVNYLPMIDGVRLIAAKYGWTIHTHVIYEHDQFEVDLGAGLPIHRPAAFAADRGQIVGAWARATHRDGRAPMVEVMRAEDIAKAKAVAKTDQVWKRWPSQMAEKTVGHRIAKKLPLDPADREHLDRVIDAYELAPGESTALLYGTPQSSPGNGEAAAPTEPDPSAGTDGQQAGDASTPASPAPGTDPDFGGEDGNPDIVAAQAASAFKVAVPQTDPARGGWVNGLTLAEINARGEDGLKFFAWALGRQNTNEELKAQASAYAKVELPALWAELAEVAEVAS